MNPISFVPLRDSISTQLLKTVFAFYLILVVTVTVSHMVAEYAHTKSGVIRELKALEMTVKPGLDQALWEMNLTQMRSIVIGISQLPEIVGVRVGDDRGNVIEQIGRVRNRQGDAMIVSREGGREMNSASGLFWHEIPLFYTRGDRKFPVGVVTMYSDSGVVFDRIRFGFLLLIISMVLQIIGFWMLFLWISRRKLSRPLAELTHAAGQLDLDNLENIDIRVHASGRNELKVLEETFNAMIRKLLAAREKLRALNQRLRNHQEELERRVRERTAALHQSEAELRALFAGMTDVVLLLNREGRYLKIAPTSPELLYRPADEMVGKTVDVVFPKDQADFFLERIHRSLETQAVVSLEYSLNIEGAEFWFDGRIAPMSDDTVVFVARDMTERKQFEEKLQRAKETAESANNAKSAFLANMSHELRTPLSAVLGYAQVLTRSSRIGPEERGHLDIIVRNGECLLALINDVLELSQIDANRMKFQPADFDLRRMLGELETMFRPQTKRKGLTLAFEYDSHAPGHIRTDPYKLRQILVNLLSNAVKYTENGGIVLRVTDSAAASGEPIPATRLLFEISDTGIGIAPDDIKHIYNPFIRVDENRYNTGTGLGLSICRNYVRLLGGEIDVKSRVGKGSTFFFHIPAEAVEQSVTDSQHPAMRRRVGLEPGQSRFRIPVADENGQKTSPDVSPKTLAALPPEWVADLRQGAEDVDVDLLLSAIERIRGRDAVLADALMCLAHDFEYDEILALIGQPTAGASIMTAGEHSGRIGQWFQ